MRPALLLGLSFALCTASPTNKLIHGVQVYNYDKADTMQTGTDGEEKKVDWILALKATSNKQVHTVCADGNSICIAEGHPSEGGVPFAAIRASEEELADLVRKHASDIEFIEPSLPVFVEPPEGEEASVAFHEEPLQQFGSNVKLGQQLLQAPGEYYVLCLDKLHKVIGWGPLKSRNAADNKFTEVIQTCQAVVITPVDEYKVDRAQGNANDSRLQAWWKCKQRGSTGCDSQGPSPTPGTLPRRRTATPRRRVSPSPTPAVGAPTNRYGLDRIDQRKSRDGKYSPPGGLDGSGVHVYVLDSGMRTTHQDFGGRAIPTLETYQKKVVVCNPSDSSCARDTLGHGTHCSGTLGGKVSGVAKGATLHAVKVMSTRGDATTTSILMGIDWVTFNAIKPALMSMSLGGDGFSRAMNFSISRAYDAGILSVVAAGNIGNGGTRDGQACSQTPANVPVAYVVAASDKSDQRARYSNFGKCTNIWAPGDLIMSTMHGSDRAFALMSGTSMACPHVSGAVAIMLQKYPTLTPAQITETLNKYATPGVVRNPGAGSPNLMLYLTDYEVDMPKPTNPPTPSPPSDVSPRSRRRRRSKKSRRRRRAAPKTRRRRRATTRRRATRRRR